MARTVAELPKGSRITDHISLGVIAKCFPRELVDRILEETGKSSRRERALPAPVMVYYGIAMALFMQVSCREVLRCLLEGLQWLSGSFQPVSAATRGGIAQARSRLHEAVVAPIAVNEPERRTRGAWYRGWRLTTLDGSSLDVADTAKNAAAFGRPGASRGQSAYPQLRFVSLVENGTHVLFGSQMGPYAASETTLARAALGRLKPGMLCMADRLFFGYELWNEARATGADLLWRVKKNQILPRLGPLSDGSFVSKIYPSDKARRHDVDGVEVRVIEYTMEGLDDAEPLYRLVTTIFDPQAAPAEELAALYHERWEIENALDEFKTHLRGGQIVLRSKTPDLVEQEFYGLMMAHFAVRGLMHEAALKGDVDPDRLSFVHSVRVIRRKLATFAALPPSGKTGFAPGRPG